MKTKISILLLTVMLVATAMAGSIENLNYKDTSSHCFFFEDTHYRSVNDYNVKINADKLQGYTAEELAKDEASTIIYANGGSTSMRTIGLYLLGNADYFETHTDGMYQKELDAKYLEQEDFDELVRRMVILQEKIDALQKRVYELEVYQNPVIITE